MTRRRKVTFAGVAVGLAVVVAALGAAGAIAGHRVLAPREESKAVIDDAAAQLGIEPSELSEALRRALKNRIDEAVEDGRLAEEHADELKRRIDAEAYSLLGGLGVFGHGAHRGPGLRHLGHVVILEAAASYLGLSEAELREALHDKTLAEIAEERGKTVGGLVQQLVATQTKRIDAAVADGRLTDDHARELKAGLAERMQALVEGEHRGRRDGHRHRFWHGSGSPRAPPLFGGPPA